MNTTSIARRNHNEEPSKTLCVPPEDEGASRHHHQAITRPSLKQPQADDRLWNNRVSMFVSRQEVVTQLVGILTG